MVFSVYVQAKWKQTDEVCLYLSIYKGYLYYVQVKVVMYTKELDMYKEIFMYIKEFCYVHGNNYVHKRILGLTP